MKELETACRYAGIHKEDTASRERMAQILETLPTRFEPRSTWKKVPLEWHEQTPYLDGTPLPGKMAADFLHGARDAVLMAITLGTAFDREVRRLSYIDMKESLFLNAAGAAYVDSALDKVQSAIEQTLGCHLSDRFSPGYGDLPLETQRFMADQLSLTGTLGIHLLDTLLMVPEKSITAIAGVFDTPQPQKVRGCAVCALYPCALAKKGGSCGQ